MGAAISCNMCGEGTDISKRLGSSITPLRYVQLILKFYGDVSEPVSGNKITTRIVVIDGSGIPLLSKKNSVRLGIIKIDPQVASMKERDLVYRPF